MCRLCFVRLRSMCEFSERVFGWVTWREGSFYGVLCYHDHSISALNGWLGVNLCPTSLISCFIATEVFRNTSSIACYLKEKHRDKIK